MSAVYPSESTPIGATGKTAASLLRNQTQLSLRANFSWTLAGNVAFSASQFGLVVLLARWGSADMVGQYALAIAIAAPIMTLSMLHLRALLATDARGEYRFGEFFALRLITTASGLMIVAAVGFASGYPAWMAWLIAAAGAVSAADALSDVLHGAFQRQERLDRAGIALMCKGALGLVAAAMAVTFGAGTLGAVLAVAVSRWLVLLSYEFPCMVRMLTACEERSAWRPIWRRARLVRLAWTALPLGVVMLLMSVRTNLPRYLLGQYAGTQALGVFAGILAMTQLGALVVNALGQAASPRLAQYHATGRRRAFFRLTATLVLMGGLLGVMGVVVVALAGRQILALMLGAEFQNECRVLMVLMIASAISFASGPLGYAATASRRIRWQPVLHLVNLTATAGVAWYSVGWGAEGMAFAVLVTSVLGMVLFTGLLFTRPDVSTRRENTIPTDCASQNGAAKVQRQLQTDSPAIPHAA